MEKHSNIVTLGGNPVTLVGTIVKVGDKAKDFTVQGSDLKPHKLSDYDGKVKIISSLLSVDTGICKTETRRFNEMAAKLENVVILAISCDLPFTLGRFCAAEGIDKVITLTDHKETDFGLKYGFLMDEMRMLARGIVVIDKDGTVRYVEYVKEVGTEPDYDKAFEAVKNL
jgi:thioredoxin-dependent peroxiredoxin